MRRLALVGLVALAGCGGGDKKPAAEKRPPKVVRETKAAKREKDRARRRIEASSLPEDAKKELEEAQDLLENP